MTTPKRKSRSKLPLFLLLLAVAALGWAGFHDGGWFRQTTEVAVVGQVVRRGPLRITVVQSGNLTAKNSAKVTNEVEGQVSILELVKEGEMVEKGQIIGKLDASNLVDNRVLQNISVQNADAGLTKAQQSLEIQRSQNTSDIAKAEQNLDFARQDQKKYEDGDYPQAQKKAEEDILLAEGDLSQATERLEWSVKLESDKVITRTELETDRINQNKAQVRLDQAKRAKELLRDYDDKKQRAVFKAAVEEAMRELDRVNLQAKARLIDMEAAVRSADARLTLEREKLAKYTDQIEKSVLIAPASGIVVYARSEGRYGRQGDLIQEGATVRERQEIVTIPQAGGMVAEASLHESVIKKVAADMPVEIRVNALPGEIFHGKVNFVAVVPDSGSFWSNPDQRLFRTEIGIDDANAEMRPAMSCSVEILVDQLDDAIYVPLQAVFRRGTQTLCFVDGEERVVETGATNEEWAQILSGVQEGEIVALSPPVGFQDEQGKPEEDAPPQGKMPAAGKRKDGEKG